MATCNEEKTLIAYIRQPFKQKFQRGFCLDPQNLLAESIVLCRITLTYIDKYTFVVCRWWLVVHRRPREALGEKAVYPIKQKLRPFLFGVWHKMEMKRQGSSIFKSVFSKLFFLNPVSIAHLYSFETTQLKNFFCTIWCTNVQCNTGSISINFCFYYWHQLSLQCMHCWLVNCFVCKFHVRICWKDFFMNKIQFQTKYKDHALVITNLKRKCNHEPKVIPFWGFYESL